jgi:4-amino-4-deoxy-L-arabinose transferase-like glycosyltransferase
MRPFFISLKQHKEAVFIFILSFVLRLYMAHIDPFLHNWDEKFHALVAKNMMKEPFKPMLIVDQLNSNQTNIWSITHIWLHKQPLFMWQMALSMKLFGVSEFSIRYPSVLMGSLMILLVYRIAILVTKNKNIGIIAALLLCFSHYQLELISGRLGMDHNDMVFCFYVLASIWSYFEYINSGKWYWAILSGILSGCAILVKWLAGLLVFSAWVIYLFMGMFKKIERRKLLLFGGAIVACVAVALPWQLFILKHYPIEAQHEFAYNSKHIREVLEGHEGGNDFYYKKFPEYFGAYVWLFIFPGIFILMFKAVYRNAMSFSSVLYTLIVFVFFSFVAKTKLASYFFVVAPLCLIFISVSIFHFFSYFKKHRAVQVFLLLPILYLSFDPLDIVDNRKPSKERDKKIQNALVYKSLDKTMPANISVIEDPNVNTFENIDVLFYTNRFACYWLLDEKNVEELLEKKAYLAVFKHHDLPDYIKTYPYLYIINQGLE